MIRGPKIDMYLWRYTSATDTGGGLTKSWTKVAKLKGVLTFIWSDERVSADRERLENRYQFWMQYRSGLDITSKDEFTSVNTAPDSVSPYQRYRVVYPDNILEQNKVLKIDLVQTR